MPKTVDWELHLPEANNYYYFFLTQVCFSLEIPPHKPPCEGYWLAPSAINIWFLRSWEKQPLRCLLCLHTESRDGTFRKRDTSPSQTRRPLPCLVFLGLGFSATSRRLLASLPSVPACRGWEGEMKQIALTPICDMDSCHCGCLLVFCQLCPRTISELFVPEIIFW